MAFAKDSNDSMYLLGAMNTKAYQEFMRVITPTIDYNPGPVSRGAIVQNQNHSEINKRVEDCIFLSKSDWDSFETSWDFKRHPLV